VLGEHPQVHALERESRFLVDPGGFEDLARALTVAYTPFHADDALGRLAWLLNVQLTGHSEEVFRVPALPAAASAGRTQRPSCPRRGRAGERLQFCPATPADWNRIKLRGWCTTPEPAGVPRGGGGCPAGSYFERLGVDVSGEAENGLG
jgi:hypothetical protein